MKVIRGHQVTGVLQTHIRAWTDLPACNHVLGGRFRVVADGTDCVVVLKCIASIVGNREWFIGAIASVDFVLYAVEQAGNYLITGNVTGSPLWIVVKAEVVCAAA